jgi:hypothetical protein
MKNKNLLIGAGVVVAGYLIWKKIKNKSVVAESSVVAPETPLVKKELNLSDIPTFFIASKNLEGLTTNNPMKYTNAGTTFFKQNISPSGSSGTPTFIQKDEYIKTYSAQSS